MAVDALEYEDEERNPAAQALDEILESPERLKDLDLDAFAEELERQVSDGEAFEYAALVNSRCTSRIIRGPPKTESYVQMYLSLTLSLSLCSGLRRQKYNVVRHQSRIESPV